MKKSVRRLLGLWLRRTAFGRTFLDFCPCDLRFLDGQVRVVPRRTMRLFETWERFPELRAEKYAVYAAYRGGDFIDVGAFHGYYSLMLAPKAGNDAAFVSIEPDNRALPMLYHSMSIIKEYFPHVSVTVFDRPAGRGECYQVSFPAGESQHPSFVGSGHALGGPKSLTVDQIVSWCELEPTFVKIDVEGAECDVLVGMRDTLAKFKPHIMLETHPMWLPNGLSVEELVRPLVDLGYSCSPITELRGIWSVEGK